MGLAHLDADLIRHMIFIPETRVILTLYWELGFHPRFANWELGFPHIVVGNWDWDFILDMQILVGTLSIKTHWDFVRWDFVCLPIVLVLIKSLLLDYLLLVWVVARICSEGG